MGSVKNSGLLTNGLEGREGGWIGHSDNSVYPVTIATSWD